MDYVSSNYSAFQSAPSGLTAGLDHLLSLNTLLIEFAGVCEIDSFIKTASEDILYSSHNSSECCDCTGESTREILLQDSYGRPVMQFIRDFDTCCRGGWTPQTLIVQAPAGAEIGRVVVTPGFFSNTNLIHDVSGNAIASFERNFGRLFSIAYDFTAPLAGGLQLQLATLEQRNSCSSAVLQLDFVNATDVRLKVLLIGASYLIYLMLREKRRN